MFFSLPLSRSSFDSIWARIALRIDFVFFIWYVVFFFWSSSIDWKHSELLFFVVVVFRAKINWPTELNKSYSGRSRTHPSHRLRKHKCVHPKANGTCFCPNVSLNEIKSMAIHFAGVIFLLYLVWLFVVFNNIMKSIYIRIECVNVWQCGITCRAQRFAHWPFDIVLVQKLHLVVGGCVCVCVCSRCV